MTSPTKTFVAPADGLSIAVTMNERHRSIEAISIHCLHEPDASLHIKADSAHLTRTRIQHSTPRGLHLDGGIACEPAEDPDGGIVVRANLRFGYGSEQNYTRINNVEILRFFQHMPQHETGTADAGAGQAAGRGTAAAEPGARAVAPVEAAPAAEATPPGRIPAPVAADCAEDLFPYVYLRPLPRAGDDNVSSLAYVSFTPTGAGPPLYAALTAVPALSRSQMVAEALSFRAGDAPYADLYVADCTRLDWRVRLLPKAVEAERVHGAAPAELMTALEKLFAVAPHGLRACLDETDYVAAIERVWQSYFAELIVAGDSARLAGYQRVLAADHLLCVLVAAPGGLGAAQLATLRAASILLPAALFPLPALRPPGDNERAGFGVCAIGELQMVRQTLLRYEAGDLARIENIMPGERRETRRTRTDGQQQHDIDDSSGTNALEQRTDDVRNSLVKQAQRAIAEQTVLNKYNNFDTTYGPPAQAKLNGSWTEWTKQGTNPASDEQTEFARTILGQSLAQVARNVRQVQARSSYTSNEDSLTSTIDNSAGTAPMLCAFRWLNKVYRASVISHGHRLMVEFMLAHPGAALRAAGAEEAGTGVPVSLSKKGIDSFAQVDPACYAALAACYQVADVAPPPAETRYLSVTLCKDEQRSLGVPAGYFVNEATVTYVAEKSDADSTIILIGREKFKPGDVPSQDRTFGEDESIALCVYRGAAPAKADAPKALSVPAAPATALALPSRPLAAPAADDPAPSDPVPDDPPQAPVALPAAGPGAPPEVFANVVLECRRGAALLDEWRIKTYAALLRGYRIQLASFRQCAGVEPLRARAQICHQLRQGCSRVLLARADALAGSAGSGDGPGGGSLADPWLMQFIDELFEWSKMSTRFYALASELPMPQQPVPDQLALTEFVDAHTARVLLPVSPGHEAALLYFVSSGERWDGIPADVPVDEDNAALMQELAALRGTAWQAPVGAGWEIVVPTTMQVQDAAFSAPSREASRHEHS